MKDMPVDKWIGWKLEDCSDRQTSACAVLKIFGKNFPSSATISATFADGTNLSEGSCSKIMTLSNQKSG